VTLLGAAGYDNTLFTLAGSNDAVEGAYLYLPTAMYLGEDRNDIPEVDLFVNWMQQTNTGANIDLFTVYGWVSAELFVQALKAAGPQATRASLLSALQQIDNFDANGLLAPGGPASKRPATCYIMAQVHSGKFERVDSPRSKMSASTEI
jgi:ABC-type branched-subunit amino acid transport system substrate-binding protein